MKIACDQATQSASGLSNNTKPAQVIKARAQRCSIDFAANRQSAEVLAKDDR